MLCGNQGTIINDATDRLLTVLTIWLQGKVYDVTGNKAYQPGGSYNGMLS
jgi:cytochrome b involved in lipid metabolism